MQIKINTIFIVTLLLVCLASISCSNLRRRRQRSLVQRKEKGPQGAKAEGEQKEQTGERKKDEWAHAEVEENWDHKMDGEGKYDEWAHAEVEGEFPGEENWDHKMDGEGKYDEWADAEGKFPEEENWDHKMDGEGKWAHAEVEGHDQDWEKEERKEDKKPKCGPSKEEKCLHRKLKRAAEKHKLDLSKAEEATKLCFGDEVPAGVVEGVFNHVDRDDNGMVDELELEAALEHRRENHYEEPSEKDVCLHAGLTEAVKNHELKEDKAVEVAKHCYGEDVNEAEVREKFNHVDHDKDGNVNEAELEEGVRKAVEHHLKDHGEQTWEQHDEKHWEQHDKQPWEQHDEKHWEQQGEKQGEQNWEQHDEKHWEQDGEKQGEQNWEQHDDKHVEQHGEKQGEQHGVLQGKLKGEKQGKGPQ